VKNAIQQNLITADTYADGEKRYLSPARFPSAQQHWRIFTARQEQTMNIEK
jgi:uncharacterized DUF497 family protein